jgi:LysR family transcriptional activator of nhaA
MDWLNYHHLLYFWCAAREGGLTPASKVLRLARPTLSGQIHALEERLGEKLFERSGRNLVLTETGRVVFRYADEILTLGREMLDTVAGRTVGTRARLDVGVVDVVTKLVVRQLLEPALQMSETMRLVCHEETHERLLSRLASNELDLIIADAPVPPGSGIRAYNHLLGECGVTFFAHKRLAGLRRGFPQSLNGQPNLMPMEGAPLRRALNAWIDTNALRPRIVGEFEDSALLKVFGADGVGVFAAPTAVERQVRAQYRVQSIGRVEDVRERFYVITGERRIRNPAVMAITDAARANVFR